MKKIATLILCVAGRTKIASSKKKKKKKKKKN